MTTSERFLQFSDAVYNANQLQNDKDDEYYHDRQYYYGYEDVDDNDEDYDNYLRTQKEINTNKLIELYKEIGKDNWFGRVLRMAGDGADDDIYVECGKQMVQMFTKDGPHGPYKQITIRDIKLCKSFQKKGLLTAFVEYLLSLDGIKAVQFESVQSDLAKDRLTKSTHWYKQGISENYVRFKEKENNEKFSLF